MTKDEYIAFLPRCYDEEDVNFLLELASKELNPIDEFAVILAAEERKQEMRREVK